MNINDRLTRHLGILYLEYRCAVIEEGDMCNNRHLEPVKNIQEAYEVANLGFICSECDKKGYAWYTRILGHVDEDSSLVKELATDPLGARNHEFRSESEAVGIDNKGRPIYSVNKEQKEKGKKGELALKGWSLVREYPQYGDILMLRNSEAKDPAAPFIERKQRTVVGLANLPKTEKNPFEDMFDD